MNTYIKKALCLTLILSLSAPMQAGWWDTLFTKQNAIIAGTCIASAAALTAYCYKAKQVETITIAGTRYNTQKLPLVSSAQNLTCRVEWQGENASVIDINTGNIVFIFKPKPQNIIILPPVKDIFRTTDRSSLSNKELRVFTINGKDHYIRIDKTHINRKPNSLKHYLLSESIRIKNERDLVEFYQDIQRRRDAGEKI